MTKSKFDLDTEDDNTIEVDDEDLNEGDEPDDEEGESEEDAEEGDDEADGEGQDEGSEDEDGEEEDAEPRRVESRGSNRFRTLSTKRREAEARAQKAETEREALRRQIEALTNTTSTQQQADRKAYLDSLTPEARAAYMAMEAVEQNKAQLARMQFDMQDNVDKNGFETKFSVRDDIAKFIPKVEALHKKVMTEMGVWAPREEILKNLIGDMVLKNKLKSTSYKQAKKSVKKNKVKVASGGRSDVSNDRSGRRNPSADRMKRLGGATF